MTRAWSSFMILNRGVVACCIAAIVLTACSTTPDSEAPDTEAPPVDATGILAGYGFKPSVHRQYNGSTCTVSDCYYYVHGNDPSSAPVIGLFLDGTDVAGTALMHFRDTSEADVRNAVNAHWDLLGKLAEVTVSEAACFDSPLVDSSLQDTWLPCGKWWIKMASDDESTMLLWRLEPP